MASILIAYDTGEGQTRKIAQYMGNFVSRSGHDVQGTRIGRPSMGL